MECTDLSNQHNVFQSSYNVACSRIGNRLSLLYAAIVNENLTFSASSPNQQPNLYSLPIFDYVLLIFGCDQNYSNQTFFSLQVKPYFECRMFL